MILIDLQTPPPATITFPLSRHTRPSQPQLGEYFYRNVSHGFSKPIFPGCCRNAIASDILCERLTHGFQARVKRGYEVRE